MSVRQTMEQEVLDVLLSALPANEYIVHSNVDWMALKHERPGVAEGEMDLVICHQRKGVLVLEVKSGGLSFDLCRDSFLRREVAYDATIACQFATCA